MPKSSMPMIVHASGVLAAPAKTATKPIPASKAVGNGIKKERKLPNVAPIKNSGVTSPPLNAAPSVTAVNRIFSAKSYAGNCSENDSTITGMPNPMYRVVPIPNTANATITPPITGLNGGNLIFFLKTLPK